MENVKDVEIKMKKITDQQKHRACISLMIKKKLKKLL